MSSPSAPSTLVRTIAYGVVALAIAFELVVVWVMLNPQVPADYRAYYIDQTTTCLNQPVSGEYILGSTVSFRSEGLAMAKPLRVCGWEGPAGDGTHSVGTSSRLRFALPEPVVAPLMLHLELVAIERAAHPSQQVDLEANGVALGAVTALAGIPLAVDLPIPPEALVANPGAIELVLHYADAIRMSPGDSETRRRAIKLLSARLGPSE